LIGRRTIRFSRICPAAGITIIKQNKNHCSLKIHILDFGKFILWASLRADAPIGAIIGVAISVKSRYKTAKNQLGFPRPKPHLSVLGLGMTAKVIFAKVEHIENPLRIENQYIPITSLNGNAYMEPPGHLATLTRLP
jgi:hypothetical protein